ncbi:MAG: magnesium/cobalt transporter CorA [Leptospiraceae bacterium]|nr:magnesium/cobalt transporter CorA [Leptospiraceae bacterium]MCP5496696.1 magnesium/cobalt transporter CorA [Leptospiraceae bacterium]
MTELVKTRTKKIGLPAGALVHIGDASTEKIEIKIIDYNEDNFKEIEVENVEECFPFKNSSNVTWINVSGIHQVDIIEKLGIYFDLHPLILEDILNTDQRLKMEDFESYIFIVMKMILFNEKKNRIEFEQVSFILSSNFVISFQEKKGDIFKPIAERIKAGKGRIRKMHTDYLVYALIDSIVDNYFIILEYIEDQIEDLEEDVVSKPVPGTLKTIHNLKKEMIYFRKSVWPLREVLSNLQRTDTKLIKQSTHIFLRDVYDHTIQVIDTIENFRTMVSGMLDIYLSSISYRMNEVMKVLTIMSTIFIPLTFIVGVYGMNFKNMPELEWHWGYYFILFFMSLIGMGMLVFFRKKKWL